MRGPAACRPPTNCARTGRARTHHRHKCAGLLPVRPVQSLGGRGLAGARSHNDVDPRAAAKEGHRLHRAERHPHRCREQRGRAEDGSRVAYDYLVITTGPKLSFEEVPGSGPPPHAFDLHDRPCGKDLGRLPAFPGRTRAGHHRRDARRSCFGPAYEFSFIFGRDLRRRKRATRFPLLSSPANPISDIWGWEASAIQSRCSKASFAATTSSGSPTPR